MSSQKPGSGLGSLISSAWCGVCWLRACNNPHHSFSAPPTRKGTALGATIAIRIGPASGPGGGSEQPGDDPLPADLQLPVAPASGLPQRDRQRAVLV